MSVPVTAIAVLRIGILEIEILDNVPLAGMTETTEVHRSRLLAAPLPAMLVLVAELLAVELLAATIPVRVDAIKVNDAVVNRNGEEETLLARESRIAIAMKGKRTRTKERIESQFASTNLNPKNRLPRRCNKARNRFARSVT
jgi:hypothetical protein